MASLFRCVCGGGDACNRDCITLIALQCILFFFFCVCGFVLPHSIRNSSSPLCQQILKTSKWFCKLTGLFSLWLSLSVGNILCAPSCCWPDSGSTWRQNNGAFSAVAFAFNSLPPNPLIERHFCKLHRWPSFQCDALEKGKEKEEGQSMRPRLFPLNGLSWNAKQLLYQGREMSCRQSSESQAVCRQKQQR